MKNYNKILVANRGEIALRVIRALKELNIGTVAVYSEADKNSLYTKLADECVCIGPASALNSYLNSYRLLSAAKVKKVDAIHPGIGFYAENGEFNDLCREYGIDFIGPGSEVIKRMGNKDTAKKVAEECGVPIIEGSTDSISTVEECKDVILKIGTPVLLKAAAGGGGKGIRLILDEKDIEAEFDLCQKEAVSAFNNDTVIVEKYLQNARHIEVQIIGDQYGNVVHLGDRECTIQRANQKIIEEARSENISDEVRKKLYADAVKIAGHIDYVGPGTVEFLVLPDDTYYFLEMNTRLQVEHTITELVTGVDIVKEQIRVIQGDKLSITQEEIKFDKYALQCRILAEDVTSKFNPSFGVITKLNLPGGNGVRVDSGIQCNDIITPYYDSLLLKICCFDVNKESARKKMMVSLEELNIEGIHTNIQFLKYVLGDTGFIEGEYDTNYVNEKIIQYQAVNHIDAVS